MKVKCSVDENDLETSDLVISLADKPVALAGIMGGGETNLPKSRRVVLEGAWF